MNSGVNRRLVALPRGNRRIYLSWSLLSTDVPNEPFYVERRRLGAAEWQQVSSEPIVSSTDFLDSVPDAVEYEYRVVGAGKPSRSVRTNASALATNLAIEFPLRRRPQNEMLRHTVGDLNNDGTYDIVLLESVGGRLRVCAYSLEGNQLWEIDTGLPDSGGWDGRSYHVPVAVYDINGDGRSEVVFHRGPGVTFPNNYYAEAGADETLIAVDGETGETVWEVPWPATNSRVMLTIGHLEEVDKPPAIVVQDGTYQNVRLTAIDGLTGRVLWSVEQQQGAGHNLDIADVDEDGRQEVIAGVHATKATARCCGGPNLQGTPMFRNPLSSCQMYLAYRHFTWSSREIQVCILLTLRGRLFGPFPSGMHIGAGLAAMRWGKTS